MRTLLATFAFISLLTGRAMADPAGIEGFWITESGNVLVEVAPCGEALCGTIVEVLSNASMSEIGKEMPADAPGVGTMILIDLVASGEGQWSGEIFNRENGKTYSCKVGLASARQMTVRGYVGLPLFGKTQVWRRADG